ncbi:MAG: LysR family transcriptional regulator, partial [Achromobacter pestifer]
AVTAAVSAGLAVGALSCRLAPPDSIEVSQRFGLPPLPPSRIMLHSTLSDRRTREALLTLAAAYREHRTTRQAIKPD